MTVKEMIEILSKENPNAEVFITVTEDRDLEVIPVKTLRPDRQEQVEDQKTEVCFWIN